MLKYKDYETVQISVCNRARKQATLKGEYMLAGSLYKKPGSARRFNRVLRRELYKKNQPKSESRLFAAVPTIRTPIWPNSCWAKN
jgi:hypothetical protein